MNVSPIVSEWLSQPGGIAPKLRELRTGAGMYGSALAGAVGWPQSKVSRLENGRQMPSESDLRLWAKACGDEAAAGPLVAMLEAGRTLQVSWRQRERRGIALVQSAYNAMAHGASVIRHFEVAFVPGPLQTDDYARALLTKLGRLDPEGDPWTADEVEAAVGQRKLRRTMMLEGKPFEFLVTEAVLRFLPVPAAVMADQLARLQIATDLSNVRFGVIPFGVELEYAPQNKFELYDDDAVVETYATEEVVSATISATYARIWPRLWADAVEGDEARALIVRAADALR